MGCFSVPPFKREAPGSPQSFSSKDSSLLNNKPVELPSPTSLNHQSAGATVEEKPGKDGKSQPGSRFMSHEPRVLSDPSRSRNPLDHPNVPLAFSAPLTGSCIAYSGIEASTFSGLLGPSCTSFSDDGERKKPCALQRAISLRRAASFGGRPQPLPVPMAEEILLNKPMCLPLPAPQDTTTSTVSSPSSELRFMSGTSSFVSTSRPTTFASQDGIGSWSNRRGRVTPEGGLPLPPPSVATKLLPSLEAYEFNDLVRATQEFAPECCLEKGEFGAVYRAWMKDSSSADHSKTQLAVVRLAANAVQDVKAWRAQVQMLAQLPNTIFCTVKGYCTHEETTVNGGRSRERLLVFEQSANGSLYDTLFGSSCKTLLDWTARMNIALGAARGLLYLHDRAPLRIVYREFKASSVMLDKNYTPRLAGYGMAVTSSPLDKQSSFTTIMKINQVHAKSNVWSFGIVLLELLTGKCSQDAAFFCDEKNFVQWGKPFMKEESKLSLILDPRIRGNCPLKGAMKVATLVLQCLRKKEVQRPTISEVADALKSIKENYCTSRPTLSLERQTRSDVSSSSEDDRIAVDSVTCLSTCALETVKIDGCQAQNPQPCDPIRA